MTYSSKEALKTSILAQRFREWAEKNGFESEEANTWKRHKSTYTDLYRAFKAGYNARKKDEKR